MLPSHGRFVNQLSIGAGGWRPGGGTTYAVGATCDRSVSFVPAVVRCRLQDPLSCSIEEPAFPPRPGAPVAAARNAGDGRSGATRSHAQPPLRASMMGEDGEHRTFPAVSPAARWRPIGRPGV